MTAFWFLASAFAQATDPDPAEADQTEEAPEMDSEEERLADTVTGKRPPPITEEVPALELPEVDSGEGQFSSRIQQAAVALRVDPQMLHDGNIAVEALYGRDYKTAKRVFGEFNTNYPEACLGHVGNVLVWQALMMENFDFKYEGQYLNDYKRARQELEMAVMQPGNEGWEYFLLGAVLGIDSVHTMRKGSYMKALNRGFEAMKAIKKSKEFAPDFVDSILADGVYNYWRSVVTLNSSVLPDFEDKRAEGIAQMALVEKKGTFLGPAATLSLTFTWIEEGKKKHALQSALRNYQAYPQNIINNLVLARVYYYNRDYKNSERIFNEVLKLDADNQRVHYHKSNLYIRMRDYDKALSSIRKYLSFELSDSDKASAYYKMGNIHYRLKQYNHAEGAYRAAVKANGLKRAKVRLKKVKELQKG